ncbi:response regulator receiver domain-containing protein [Litoreibacter ponti]|uniref:Response regulator receiver domain-containing protein n=1 Tax=Litoreibacter ponti TaxID=1510457 RepID=A0A2T6BE14_9RHOB|nr:response regulator [Litoreibacter ponti]PTX54306.1 response regulator receiver domain-containing protein [Litoreibacter ponti]
MSATPLDEVILIDDSALDNRLHKRAIERTGLAKSVRTFSMADDAIAYFRKPGAIPTDLVLLDVNMPRMDGFELLEAATEEFGAAFDPTVVIMLTTSMDRRDQDRAAEFDVVKDYFEKPLTPEKFESLVAALRA